MFERVTTSARMAVPSRSIVEAVAAVVLIVSTDYQFSCMIRSAKIIASIVLKQKECRPVPASISNKSGHRTHDEGAEISRKFSPWVGLGTAQLASLWKSWSPPVLKKIKIRDL
jgi:hypothetical protein